MTDEWTGSVSVVIPLFDKRPYVERALRSVFAQAHPPDDVIVVDDGSTDGGLPNPEAFPNVSIVSQSHAGAGAARNRGIDCARGSWIAFLDADDEWSPGFLDRVLKAALEHPEAVAVFCNLVDDRQGRLLSIGGGTRRLDDYFAFALDNHGQGMSSSSTIVRRDVLTRLGGFPAARRGQDLDTWARLAWSGPIVYVPEPLAWYHTTVPDRLTTTPHEHIAPFPVFLQTYVAWRDAGRIPDALRLSSRRFAIWLSGQYVAAWTHDGRRGAAARLLIAGIRAGILPRRSVATTGFRLLLPVAVIRLLRRLKQRLAVRREP